MGVTNETPGLDRLFLQTTAPSLHEPKEREDLIGALETWLLDRPNAAFIVIDTLAKIRNASKSTKSVYETDYKDIEGLQQLASRHNVAILLVTHDRKEEDSDPFKTITGSTGITGAADAAWVLTRKRGETEGTLFISGRDIEERKGRLEFEKERGTWRWIGNSLQLLMNSLELDIRNAMLTTGKPVSPNDICEAVTPKRKLNTIQRAMQRMVEKGALEKAAGQHGKYILPPEDIYYGKPGGYRGEHEDEGENGLSMDHF